MSKVYVVIKRSFGDFDISQKEIVCASLSMEEANIRRALLTNKLSDEEIQNCVSYTVEPTKLI